MRVSAGQLTVRHGPFPWPGNHTLHTSELDQLYCTEHHNYSRNGGRSTSYRVNAVLNGGWKIKLLSSMTEAEQALFVEQQVEQHLNIDDRRVGGEMAG